MLSTDGRMAFRDARRCRGGLVALQRVERAPEGRRLHAALCGRGLELPKEAPHGAGVKVRKGVWVVGQALIDDSKLERLLWDANFNK